MPQFSMSCSQQPQGNRYAGHILLLYLVHAHLAVHAPHLLPSLQLIRRSHPQEQSTAAPAAKGQPPAPSASQVADLLYNKWLMDVPKMMDLAVLYAPGSAQLVQQLLHQLLVLQPRYAQVCRLLSLNLQPLKAYKQRSSTAHPSCRLK